MSITARLFILSLLLTALALPGCGGDGPGGGSDPDAPSGDGLPPAGDDDLVTSAGCNGVFNPDQMVEYALEMDPGDWATVQADASNSIYVPATLSCDSFGPIDVSVRRKRSGGTTKVGLKVDINDRVPGQDYFGLKKLSLENGISEGSGEASAEALYAEYLGWRLMVRSGAITGRAALATVRVNGDSLGVYVNVEQVDKRFLRDRLGDDTGWLFKFSGSDRDGQKTNESVPDPYADYFCFLERNGCPTPPDATLAAELPARLDIPQVLRMGAVNAIMGNTDSPLLKLNNYYYYDWDGGPRTYLPWDLDTAMKDGYDVFSGTVPGGTTVFTDALFGDWEADYAQIVDELIGDRIARSVIESELDRALSVSGEAMRADPLVTGDPDGAIDALEAWWTARLDDVRAQLDAR